MVTVTRPRHSRASAIETLCVGIFSVLILAWRAPFAMRRLWAEDGGIFLQQAIDHGIVRSFGTAYAGYYLLVPRLIGGFASAVPLRDAAFATWLGVAAVVGWCAVTIYVESEGLLSTRPTRVLVAFSIVLLPAAGLEAIANSADLQYTLIFAALVALAGMSTNRWLTFNRVAMVSAAALTTPLVIFLAPVAVLRILRCRPRRADATVIAWAVATAIQFGMILIFRPARNVGAPGKKDKIASHFDHRVVYTNLLPERLAIDTVAPLAALLGVGLVLLAVALAWRHPRRASAAMMLLLPMIAFAFWTFAGAKYGLPARYRVFPALCVVLSVVIAWEELLRAIRPREPVDWRPAGIIVVLLALSWATFWRPAPYRSSGPTWSASLARAELVCRNQSPPIIAVRISPVAPGSGIWSVRLPCRDIA